MKTICEKRREARLNYQWPVWFAEDFGKTLFKGHMSDISSCGAAFTCDIDDDTPHLGQKITTLFSIPRHQGEMASLIRIGRICRIDKINDFIRKVAIQFAEPLQFNPGEQTAN